ncbi:pyridoxal-dependent decarboxylase [Paraburkholderia sp. WC7.3g]|uniref:pyridoxal-dependent decarboxylase n=1 Tax=Paraburkholderia sp. WC7.3g TaxID=2991070 RepID=UPI003D23D2D6
MRITVSPNVKSISSEWTDANPMLNMSSFVTTWAEPEAAETAKRNIFKNYIDHDMYPQAFAMELLMVQWLHHRWNGPKGVEPYGTATVGSSEACMLAGLAHKWNWRKNREAQGKDGSKPNMVTDGNVQIVWKKFLRDFDVEPRIVPLTPGNYRLTAEHLDKYVDQNTIAVVALAGQTFTGGDDDIQGEMPTATLNFSRNALQVAVQYYMFLRHGFEGYRRIMQHTLDNAIALRGVLVESGYFTMVNETQRILVVAVTLDSKIKNFNEFDVSNKVREKGWVLSAYSMPPNAESVNSLRVVVRPHVNRTVAGLLANDIVSACKYLEQHGGNATPPELHRHAAGQETPSKC